MADASLNQAFQELSLADLPAKSITYHPSIEDPNSINNEAEAITINFSDEDFETRCNSSQNIFLKEQHSDFSCLQFNIGGRNYPKRPTAEQRKNLVKSILETIPVDLYFIQECSWKSALKGQLGSFHNYAEVVSEDTFILYKKEMFSRSDISESDIQRAGRNLQVDRARFSLARLEHKSRKFEFLAFSWHADRRGTQNSHFIQLCWNLSVKFNLPILIGGDFNKELTMHKTEDNVTEARSSDQDILKMFGQNFPLYIPTQLCFRQRVIDFFIGSIHSSLDHASSEERRTAKIKGIPSILLYKVQELPHEPKILGPNFQVVASSYESSIELVNISDHYPVIAYANFDDLKIISDI